MELGLPKPRYGAFGFRMTLLFGFPPPKLPGVQGRIPPGIPPGLPAPAPERPPPPPPAPPPPPPRCGSINDVVNAAGCSRGVNAPASAASTPCDPEGVTSS